MKTQSASTFTCPWWLLFTFDNPIRKLMHDPHKILSPFVNPGNKVLDVGCGMGYFTLELARLVGETGRVIAADLQPQMLAGLVRRANRTGVQARIQPLLCTTDKIGIPEPIDLAFAFWMVHEVRERKSFLQEIYSQVKPGGMLFIVEPIIHVTSKNLDRTVELCTEIGFTEITHPRVSMSRSIVLLK
jgi:ubiquinone/menaquinone biosynthesis C-methylase UbiE